MFSKDHAIIAQNSASVAAVVTAAIIEANPAHATTTDSALELFDRVRTHIFNGSLALAGAESVVNGLEGPTVEEGMDGTPAGMVIGFGIHKTKTVGEVAALAPGVANPRMPDQDGVGYLKWVVGNSKNARLVTAVKTYLHEHGL